LARAREALTMTKAPPVDEAWLARNLGIAPADPIEAAAAKRSGAPTATEERARMLDLIQFDSEGPAGASFLAAATLGHPLSEFVDIPWPAGIAPAAGPAPTGMKLPRADVLIVTWTADEGHALSRVLTPGFDSRDDWLPYTRNFAAIAARMRASCPAVSLGRLGTYWTATIGGRRVTLFKSDSHMSQDGPKLPNADVWRQIIDDVRPSLVITTGTGGGIGPTAEVGDVIVSAFVTFSCHGPFKQLDGKTYRSAAAAATGRFKEAEQLFAVNAGFLPKDNTRPPAIVSSTSAQTGILTTDYFGFDNSTNTYGLQGQGDLSEMGDAVLGMVCAERPKTAPAYVIVRNVSDPQIAADGKSIRQQAKIAGDIYKGFGRWSTVCSAIVCWAIVAGMA
jgi:nucleoside phosphorylase